MNSNFLSYLLTSLLMLLSFEPHAIGAEGHTPSDKLLLTQEEKAYLNTHPTLRVQAESNWPPFNFTQYGQAKGFSNDYMRLLAEASGLNFEFVGGHEWSEYVDMLKQHKIDLISNMAITPERKAFAIFTEQSIVSVADSLLTLKSTELSEGLDSVRDNKLVLGIVKGFYHEELLKRHYPEIPLLLANDIPSLIKLVSSGKADAALSTHAVFSFYLNKEHNFDRNTPALKNSVILDHSLFNPSPQHMGINIDDKPLKSILDKAMRMITEQQLNELRNRWLVSSQATTPLGHNKNKVNWSKDEQQYFTNKKVISMCVDPDWMPLESINNGKHVGMAADYIQKIQTQLGTPIELVITQNWSESLEFAKNRQCDILSMAMETPERATYLNFTDPYLTIPLVLAAKKNALFIADMSIAANKPLGIVKDYAYGELLKTKHPKLTFVEVASVSDGLQKVAKGELFGLVGALSIIGYELQYNFPELKIAGQFDENWYLGIGVRNDKPLLLSALNKAIESIPKNTLQEITNKWISVRYDKAANFSDLWKYLALVFFVISIVIYRQHVLKKYNGELQKLSNTDALTGCANRQKIDDVLLYQINLFKRHQQPFSIILCDLDRFKEVNDQYGHLAGDTILKGFTTLISTHIRANDLIGRWGGDEFLIICPNTNSEGAKQLAIHLKQSFSSYLFSDIGHVTASFGIAEYNNKDMATEALLNCADIALYDSKKSGRNQVKVYNTESQKMV